MDSSPSGAEYAVKSTKKGTRHGQPTPSVDESDDDDEVDVGVRWVVGQAC
jgi:hypothetical protein